MEGKAEHGRRLRAIRDFCVDSLFPAQCALCLEPASEGLCAGCHADLPLWRSECQRCGDPLASIDFCPTCARRPSPLSVFRAAGSYAWPLQQMILAWKNGGRRELAEPLAYFFEQALIGDMGFEPDRVLPVPLHPARHAERGFNQAEVLARALCRRRGWRLDTRSLLRVRATPHQQGLTRRERQANLQNAFAIRDDLQGAGILLVDDVMTTGATLYALAASLRAAGVVRVGAAVLARA